MLEVRGFTGHRCMAADSISTQQQDLFDGIAMEIKTNQEGQILRIILLFLNPISKGKLMFIFQGLSVIITKLLSQWATNLIPLMEKYCKLVILALTVYSCLPCLLSLYTVLYRMPVCLCVFIYKYIYIDIPHIIPPNNPHKHKYTTNLPLAE